MGKNKEHKIRCYLYNRAWKTDVLLGFEVQQRLHRLRGLEVSCQVLNSNICCLDIASEKQSVYSTLKFI